MIGCGYEYNWNYGHKYSDDYLTANEHLWKSWFEKLKKEKIESILKGILWV